jgi:membrane protease YdiL (CAAX protease family)
MIIMPVGNMVLLARELLLGHLDDLGPIVMVIASTCLYAAAAVVLATKTFGKEAAIFADAASYRALFQRRFYLPQRRPTAAQALLLIAMLFPVWFYFQTGLGSLFEENLEGNLVIISLSMLALIAGAPILLAAYRKIDLVNTFSWRGCSPRYLLGATLIGLSAWALAHEIIVFQGVSESMFDQFKPMADAIDTLPFAVIWLVFALVPGVSEELLFRGFFLSGLRSVGRWTALIIVGVVFGMFHFLLIRFAVTALLGITLAYLCWQSRSLFPCILTHILHNTVSISLPRLAERFDLDAITTDGHLPISILILAAFAFTCGIALFIKPSPEPAETLLDSHPRQEDPIPPPEPATPI